MLILAMDTSGNTCNVALSDGAGIIARVSAGSDRSYLGNLVPMIDRALRSASLTIGDVGLFSVVLGPGSWTGIRIGVATAKSLAHSLGKPVIGLCALDVLAHNLRYVGGRTVYPIIDGSRGQVYFAGYDCRGAVPRRTTEYGLLKLDSFLESIETPAVLLGDACSKYAKMLPPDSNAASNPEGEAIAVAPRWLAYLRSEYIIEATVDKFERSGPDDTMLLAPLYLQRGVAEPVPRKRGA